MASCRLTPKARLDLKAIARHTQKHWGKAQRDKYIAELYQCMQTLAKNPAQGKNRADIKPGYLCKRAGSHLIYYRISDANIDILGVLHKRMDPGLHL